jgi:integrase
MFFFRRGKGTRVRLPDNYPSPQFDAAYEAALTGTMPVKIGKVTGDKLDWLVERFRESGKWAQTSPATRRQRELLYLSIIKRANNPRFAAITRRHIEQAMDDRAKTPALAKNLLKALRALFAWAVKNGHMQANPCDGVEPPSYKTDGFPVWTAEDVKAFCAKWPVGTMPRLALELFLTSGLRRGDLHVAGRQHLRGDIFTMRTGKTNIDITVRFPKRLLDTIEATKTGDLHFIVKEDGQPYGSKESFGNWFSDRCRDADVKKSAHGLRKLAATMAANEGASAHELMAQFGWVKIEQAETYTRKADRQRLGISASDRAAGQIGNLLPRTEKAGSGKMPKKSMKSTPK